jgi:hypothetical protein
VVVVKINVLSKELSILLLFAVGLLIIAAAPSYYFYSKYQESQELLKNPTQAARTEVRALVERVSKLMELPSEEPTIATVSDKEKLKDQPFFAKAENRDKVLIYTQAKKAILYRESTNKIIEVSSIAIGSSQDTGSVSAQPTTTKVAIYNGTAVAGLARTASQKLAGTAGFSVVVRKDAANTYSKTILVDQTGVNSGKVAQLATMFGGTVSSLPAGEATASGADALVILGEDFAAENR